MVADMARVGVEVADEGGEGEDEADSLLPDLVMKHAESIPACSRFLDRATVLAFCLFCSVDGVAWEA